MSADDASPPPKPRRRRTLYAGLTAALMVPFIGLICLAALAARAPIEIPNRAVLWAEDTVNSRLTTGATAEFDNVALGFDPSDRAFDLIVEQARIAGAGLGAQVTLPELRVRLDALEALKGRIRPKTLHLEGGQIRLLRQLDGTISMGFGGADTTTPLPQSLSAFTALIEEQLAQPILHAVDRIEIDSLSITLLDSKSPNQLQLRNGSLALERADGGQGFRAKARMRLGGGAVEVDLMANPQQGHALRTSVSNLSLDDIVALLPAETPLSGLRSEVDAEIKARLDAASQITALSLEATLGPTSLKSQNIIAFDRANLALHYDPEDERIVIDALSIGADQLRAQATGHILLARPLNDGIALADPITTQLIWDTLELDPDGLTDTPLIFDDARMDFQLHLAPFRLDLGQAYLALAGDHLVAEGQVRLKDGAPDGALSLTSPRITIGTLKRIWPTWFLPKTQNWVVTNVVEGTAHNLAAYLKPPLPGSRRPQVTASFALKGAAVRFLPNMPVVENASGVAEYHDNRFSVRVDQGEIRSALGGVVNVAGSHVVLPDTRQRPNPITVGLTAQGAIPDVLTILDNPPLNVLSRAGREADLATGHVALQGEISTEIRRPLAFEDVTFALEGDLTGIESTTLVPGRVLRSEALEIAVSSKTGLAINGDARLDGVPIFARWQQELGRDPAPPNLSGRVRLSSETLAAFNIALPKGFISGDSMARFGATFPRDSVPVLKIESDLSGVRLAIPPLGWSKGSSATGALRVAILLTAPSAAITLDLSAPGLDLGGNVARRADGSLERISFARARLGGWINSRVEMVPSGPDMRIALRGGEVDLRRATFGETSGGDGSGGLSGVALNLDRVIVSDGIALTNFNGQLSPIAAGMQGTFEAQLNGGAPLQGRIVPSAAGAQIGVSALDAGAVLRAAGVFENARGGGMSLSLIPTRVAGNYRGRLEIEDIQVRDAPVLAELLRAISVVGLLEQLTGAGIVFSGTEADFVIRPDDIVIEQASAVGPSMAISAQGVYRQASKSLDFDGVISPIYIVNGLFGALFSPRRNEGLVGISYRLRGTSEAPQIQVNPLSILTPGVFREIFRRSPPRVQE